MPEIINLYPNTSDCSSSRWLHVFLALYIAAEAGLDPAVTHNRLQPHISSWLFANPVSHLLQHARLSLHGSTAAVTSL